MNHINLPPYSREAEQSVIGGLMLDNKKIDDVAMIIREADFFESKHRLIFRAIVALDSKKRPFDVVTVSELLESRKMLDEADGMPYLIELANETPSSANIVAYAEIVKERSTLRAIISAGTSMIERAYNTQEHDSNSILESAYDAMREIQITGDSDVPTLRDTVHSAYKQLEARHNNDGELSGLSTGFDALDASTNGLQKGEVYILAGRPAMGKSTLALNIGVNAALKNKHVLFFSLEMPKERIIDKCWSSMGAVDFNEIKTGKMPGESWARVGNANSRLLDSGLQIDDAGDQNLDKIIVKSKRIHAKKKLDLIIVDYLQLVRVRGASRLDEVSEVSRQLKALAKNLECPVIALAQLNRGVESREDKRPRLQDLRESGQIEQDADFIAFIYRDEYYYPELTDNKNVAELIIGKHRFGATSTIMLGTELSKSRFLNRGEDVYMPKSEIPKLKSQGGFDAKK